MVKVNSPAARPVNRRSSPPHQQTYRLSSIAAEQIAQLCRRNDSHSVLNGTPLKRLISEQFCTVSVLLRGYRENSAAPPPGCSIMEDPKMNMSGESLLVILIVGLVAGWLAGQIVQGSGLGLIGDLVVGIAGAFIASWAFPQLGIHLGSGIVSAIVSAAIGAVLLLVIIRLVRGQSRWGGSWGGTWRRPW
jgi:uncharacterized membrane protein YeaQ/YmgE (transglycosylase-associated protein family)